MPISKRNKQITLAKTKKQGLEGKKHLFNEIRGCVDTYKNLFVFFVSDMRNTKMKNVRNEWKDSRFFIGKNKIMAKALGRYLEEEYQPNLHKVGQMIKGQCGLLFSNQSVEVVLGWFRSYTEGDFARSGHVATADVILKEGPLPDFAHSLEPELRRLGLPTTLTKGIIHLVKGHEVCKVGDVLTPEAAKILEHLGYQMAEFHITILSAWSKDGSFLNLQTEVPDVSCNENVKKTKKKKSSSKKSLDNLDRGIDVPICEDMEVIESGAASVEGSEIDKENSKKAKKLRKNRKKKSGSKNSLDNLESAIDVPIHEDIEITENGDASLEGSKIEKENIKKTKQKKSDSKKSFDNLDSDIDVPMCEDMEVIENGDASVEGSEVDKENIKKANNEKCSSKKSLDNIESAIDVPIHEDIEIIKNDDASLEATHNTVVSEAYKNKSMRLSPVIISSSKEEKKLSHVPEELDEKSRKEGSKAEDGKEEGSEIDKELSNEVKDVNYVNLKNHSSTPKHCNGIKPQELVMPLNKAEELEVSDKVEQSSMIFSTKKIVQDNGVLNSDDDGGIRQSRPRKRKVVEKIESVNQVDMANSSQDSPLFRELRSRSIKVSRKKNGK